MRGQLGWCAVGWLLLSMGLPAQQPAVSNPGSSAARRPLTPREILVVRPLAYFQDPGQPPAGTCLAARLEIGGAPEGRVRIGVYEPEVGGTTDVWRATAWSAALVAAQLTGYDSRALQISVEVGRSIDGPSAGALLTVALIAAIRGDKLHDGVTMTGTINPDGTIGPVGGVPLKIDGAAQAAQKLVLIPFGQETEVDARTGRSVNVVQYGQMSGVEVRPVRDIWAAYEAFTGVALPRPQGNSVPDLSPEFKALLDERFTRWSKLTRAAHDKFYTWPEFTRSTGSGENMQQALRRLQEAEAYQRAGDPLAAYITAFSAALDAWIAHEAGRYIFQISSGTVAGWNRLPEQNGWLLTELQQTTDAMRNFQPRTVDQLAMYMNAGAYYCTALALHESAEDLKTLHKAKYMQNLVQQYAASQQASSAGTPEEFVQAAFSLMAGAVQITAWLECKLATDALELASRMAGSPLPADMDLLSMADHYRRGAEANLVLVDKLAVEPQCAEVELPFSFGQRLMILSDVYYGVANAGLRRVLPRLQIYLGDGPQQQYVRLASAMWLHAITAALVAKHYSVGVEMGDNFDIQRVLREQVLEDWILESRLRTESSIHELTSRNIDASTCIAGYWIARNAETKPKPVERFEALQSYFHANLMAQLLIELSRSAGAGESPDSAAPRTAPPPAPPVPAPPTGAQ